MHLLIICSLIALVLVLGMTVLVLFRDKMVDLSKWHGFMHAEHIKIAADVAALKQWVESHVHLHTTPSAVTPAPSADKK